MWYAQHGEDKKLRELIGDKPMGCYIDVGAYHPQNDSVTKHFYDAGWHGINIEPAPNLIEPFLLERPRDINLNIALSNHNGRKSFYNFPGMGLSTLDVKIGEETARKYDVDRILVPVRTLSSVCEEYFNPEDVIDFLKIDVEGHENEVLQGGKWYRYRPHFLCIEATYPCTDKPNWDSWFDFILAQDYDLLDFDGLNMWFYDRRQGR